MSDSMQHLKSVISSSEIFSTFIKSLKHSNILAKNVSGSLVSFLIEKCYSDFNKKIVVISHDNDRLVKLKDDIEILNEHVNTSLYSSKLSDSESISRILLDLTETDEFIVFANAADLEIKTIAKEKFRSSLIILQKNSAYSFDELIRNLNKYGFTRKDFVDEEGDYSVRGGIIDLFSENMESPVRIEFFGDTIESVREFDINSQRSVREVDSVKIGINLSSEEGKECFSDENITDFFPEDILLFIDEPEISLNMIKEEKLTEKLSEFKRVFMPAFVHSDYIQSLNDMISGAEEIVFDSKPQPEFHSNLRNLYLNLLENIRSGNKIFISASDEYQSKRIRELIEDFEDEAMFEKDEIIHTDNASYGGITEEEKELK